MPRKKKVEMLLTKVDQQPNVKKGRNPEQIDRRNACLAARYYYYYVFLKLRYDIIVIKLSQDFFISPVTVAKILLEKSDEIKELKTTAPSVQKLKTEWPILSWQGAAGA